MNRVQARRAGGVRTASRQLNQRFERVSDRRKARLFRPIVVMTLGGLALHVLLAVFLVFKFDKVASTREQQMVQNGLQSQLSELDAVVMPQVNWDVAVKALDHKLDPVWADTNLGDYLYTFNRFTRAFVVDGSGTPIYAAVMGKRSSLDSYRSFDAAVKSVMPRIRAAEAARPPIRPRADGTGIVTQPIQANAIARIDGQIFLVIATLVQPDTGRILPRGPRAPVAITATPVDAVMLKAFAGRYMVDDLRLNDARTSDERRAYVDLYDPEGKPIGVLGWTPRRPGLMLVRQLWLPALLAIALMALIAWIVMRSGAAIFSELVASEARAKHLAFHDPLTRLPNRALLFERLHPMLARFDADHSGVAVICVDLDRFKDVNDTLGHHAGDLLIETVANRLRAVCQDAAVIARLGGDEFVVLLDRADRAAAGAMAQRILAEVRKPVDSEYGRLQVACSVGVALIEQPGIEPSEALRWADLALYRSKDSGRTRVTFFEPAMDAALRSRRSLEADLRQALGDETLSMVYQPQVDRSGAVVAVEALVRWTHPERGNVPPGVFVPLAEECGLILALGELVLRRVFEETAGWNRVRIAINVSAVQLRSPGFAALVTRLVARAGVDPARYEIELTETALLGDDPVTAGNVEALKRLGFSIALDDFGTGYSSLSVLQRFSVDKIKIDRSFVAALGGNDESEALVDAMVKLARALNLSVIAEGVETEGQRDRLVMCGCREFQGHLIGHPMPVDKIAVLIGEEQVRAAAALKRPA